MLMASSRRIWSSEHRVRGHDESRAFRTAGHVDTKRCVGRAMEPYAEAVVALQPGEVEVRSLRRDFPGVIEERGVDEAIDHDSPLGLRDDPVLVAEAMAREAAQRRSAPHIRQEEK